MGAGVLVVAALAVGPLIAVRAPAVAPVVAPAVAPVVAPGAPGRAGVTPVATAVVTAAVPAAGRNGPAQVVTVRSATSRSTRAVVEVWARGSGATYRRVAGPWTARVGRSGIGTAREGSGRTPAGVWGLGTAFGVGTSDPGTALPWFTVDRRDWWASDVRSPSTYNRRVRCSGASCPFRRSHAEHLVTYRRAYRYAVLIRYNTPPEVVVGAGSAFFLHVGTGGPTAGCVSLNSSNVVRLLRWLRPGAVVSIGVGRRAYAPIPDRRTPP